MHRCSICPRSPTERNSGRQAVCRFDGGAQPRGLLGCALSWGDGDASAKTIAITLLNNRAVGASKTLTVKLSAPVFGSLGSPSIHLLTIAEPQWLPPARSMSTATANTMH